MRTEKRTFSVSWASWNRQKCPEIVLKFCKQWVLKFNSCSWEPCDGMPYDLMHGQGYHHQHYETFSINFQSLSTPLFAMWAGKWLVFLKFGYVTICKLVLCEFLIFGLVFVSHDFELVQNVAKLLWTVEESTAGIGLIFHLDYAVQMFWIWSFASLITEKSINEFWWALTSLDRYHSVMQDLQVVAMPGQ